MDTDMASMHGALLLYNSDPFGAMKSASRFEQPFVDQFIDLTLVVKAKQHPTDSVEEVQLLLQSFVQDALVDEDAALFLRAAFRKTLPVWLESLREECSEQTLKKIWDILTSLDVQVDDLDLKKGLANLHGVILNNATNDETCAIAKEAIVLLKWLHHPGAKLTLGELRQEADSRWNSSVLASLTRMTGLT